MTETILVAGTASHVGKSTVVTGLCRILADQGLTVAPFKAQNMSNNARAVPKATQEDTFGEVGIAQYVQSHAARRQPNTDINPVLLKPHGDEASQLILDGDVVAKYDARDYYESQWNHAYNAAKQAWSRLSDSHDVIIAEGAGSIAEINLHDRDLANVETARFTDGAIILVADIERGGAFASILGTIELLPDDIKDQVIGVVINKFRGDETLLDPGIDRIENQTGIPVLGVLPWRQFGLPEEDSLSIPAGDVETTVGKDTVPTEQQVTIIVPRLPRISNFPDLDPLATVPGVRVSYRPLTAEISDGDAVIIPGTKNTVDDLLALTEAGFDEKLRSFDGPIIGICGGYQLLGEQIHNADLEGTVEKSTVDGLGLLPVETEFQTEKTVRERTFIVSGTGPISGATGEATGYEIHMGQTTAQDSVSTPFLTPEDETSAVKYGVSKGKVLGTYFHGIFENKQIRTSFLDTVYASSGGTRPVEKEQKNPIDKAADWLLNNMEMSKVYAAISIGEQGAYYEEKKRDGN